MISTRPPRDSLGWVSILRLGLVQAALGAIVVLTTSTLNRIMVVELGLSAVIPGLLVGLHYGVQIARPLWGHGSDAGGSRTSWILGGMALLALGGAGAAVATAIMANSFAFGFVLALLDFVLIGVGVGACGTSLLALLAATVAPARRPAAATATWLTMIAGIVVTAVLTGKMLDPFSFERLVGITAATGIIAFAITVVAVWGVERSVEAAPAAEERPSFRDSLADAWADRQARLFTIFVFVSMLAYSMQDLILEPFAGLAFGMTPGETTQLSGLQHGGVFIGMVLTGALGTVVARKRPAALKLFVAGGCVLSALALAGLTMAAGSGGQWPLAANVWALGFGNGIFSVAAIAAMMALSGAAGHDRIGLRMGLWGAAQAVAFGMGGFLGTVAVASLQRMGFAPLPAYGAVFMIEGGVFVVAALIIFGVKAPKAQRSEQRAPMAALQPAE